MQGLFSKDLALLQLDALATVQHCASHHALCDDENATHLAVHLHNSVGGRVHERLYSIGECVQTSHVKTPESFDVQQTVSHHLMEHLLSHIAGQLRQYLETGGKRVIYGKKLS